MDTASDGIKRAASGMPKASHGMAEASSGMGRAPLRTGRASHRTGRVSHVTGRASHGTGRVSLEASTAPLRVRVDTRRASKDAPGASRASRRLCYGAGDVQRASFGDCTTPSALVGRRNENVAMLLEERRTRSMVVGELQAQGETQGSRGATRSVFARQLLEHAERRCVLVSTLEAFAERLCVQRQTLCSILETLCAFVRALRPYRRCRGELGATQSKNHGWHDAHVATLCSNPAMPCSNLATPRSNLATLYLCAPTPCKGEEQIREESRGHRAFRPMPPRSPT
jgi:hypothetical protein